MMKSDRNGQEGSTLIELLIVVAIIGILAAIAIPNLLTAMQRAKQKRTMADMRSATTAWEAYAVDMKRYIAAGYAQQEPQQDAEYIEIEYEIISAKLAPEYIKTLPQNDGWGSPYEYWVSATGQSYGIRSLGKDETVDEGIIGGPTTDFNCDIVYENGTFTQYPEGTQGTSGGGQQNGPA